MKNLIRICALLALVIVPMSALAQEPTDAQSKHAIKTKGAGGVDKLIPCTPPKNPNGQADSSGKHAIRTKGAGGDEPMVQSGCDATIAFEPNQPLTFSWTPFEAKPTEPVTYRLKVWQLMQGQNGTSAMRSNQPIVTKDVENVDHLTVENLIQGPCKPPYMCDFVWEVQAFSSTGKKVGSPQMGSYDLKMMK